MKKSKRTLTPKLRFPEFRDKGKWEQRFIEDYFFVGSSKRVLQQNWTTQGVPFYRTRELVSLNKNEPFTSEIFISEELFREISEKYGLPTEGDFLVSGVGTLGISYQVQSQDRFYFKDGNVLWFKQKGCIVSTFFKYCFEAEEIQNQILSQASISTVGTYTIQNAKATKFSCPPNIEEQQKIAECLSSLDGLIAAEGRKMEALKAHKKGLMQQLFPQPGQTQPRLRFPEFQNKPGWEAQRLDSVSQFIKKKIPLHQLNLDTYVSTENLSPDYGGIEQASKLPPNGSATEYKPDDILIANIRPYLKKVWRSNRSGGASNDVIVIRPKAVLRKDYLQMVIANDSFINYVMTTAKGVKMPRGDIASMKEYIVYYPSRPEQQRIADCLSALDTRITAQAAKIETLKLHKRGMMQQLFPAPEVS